MLTFYPSYLAVGPEVVGAGGENSVSPDLADRHRRFVGRVAERDLFRSVLREFADTCKVTDIPADYGNARNFESSPGASASRSSRGL